MPCRSPGPHPGEKLRGLAWGGSPGPHPGGKLRSLTWGASRPTPRGEVQGSGLGGLQAHTWGVSRHKLGGGVSQHALRQTPPQQTATAADGTHPTGTHSCFRQKFMMFLQSVKGNLGLQIFYVDINYSQNIEPRLSDEIISLSNQRLF